MHIKLDVGTKTIDTNGSMLTTDDGIFLPSADNIVRFKHWVNKENKEPCFGKIAHGICVPSVLDMPRLNNAPGLFLNKLLANYEPVVALCMERRLFSRTKLQYKTKTSDHLNMTAYTSLRIVAHHY